MRQDALDHCRVFDAGNDLHLPATSFASLSSGEFAHGAARANGFSLHAGVVAASDERDKLERLCRTITRPAVSTERLSLTAQGLIHYRLKTPYRDGTTHVVFEPLDFMARLAALVPNPRVNLTRYHGAIDMNWRAESSST